MINQESSLKLPAVVEDTKGRFISIFIVIWSNFSIYTVVIFITCIINELQLNVYLLESAALYSACYSTQFKNELKAIYI